MIALSNLTPASLDPYIPVVGAAEVEELRALAGPLEGATIEMVNSTAVGGGVAELLTRVASLDARRGIGGALACNGGGARNSSRSPRTLIALSTERSSAWPVRFRNLPRVQPPQPGASAFGLPLRGSRSAARWTGGGSRRRARGALDLALPHRLSRPDPRVWGFLQPYVVRFDGAIFSSPEFARWLPIEQYLFYPSIDRLAEKNRELERFVAGVLAYYGIDSSRTILTQISRLDPVGVVRAYRQVKRYFDCQLVLAGLGASDDPEGSQMLAEVMEAAAGDIYTCWNCLPPARSR